MSEYLTLVAFVKSGSDTDLLIYIRSHSADAVQLPTLLSSGYYSMALAGHRVPGQ